jgi:hypothetical protein
MIHSSQSSSTAIICWTSRQQWPFGSPQSGGAIEFESQGHTLTEHWVDHRVGSHGTTATDDVLYVAGHSYSSRAAAVWLLARCRAGALAGHVVPSRVVAAEGPVGSRWMGRPGTCSNSKQKSTRACITRINRSVTKSNQPQRKIHQLATHPMCLVAYIYWCLHRGIQWADVCCCQPGSTHVRCAFGYLHADVESGSHDT